MNANEFNQWIDYHAKLFGDGLRQAIADRDVLATWKEILQWVSLDDAKAATRRMIAEEALQPKGWHKHPSAVKKLCYDIQGERAAKLALGGRKFIDGEEVFNCYHCRDTGAVVIVAPRFVEAVRRKLIKREPFHVPSTSVMAGKSNWRWSEYAPKGGLVRAVRFAVACCCELGKPANFRGAVYDPDRHFAGTVPISDDEVARFDEFVESLNELQPANYESSFDDYNAGF